MTMNNNEATFSIASQECGDKFLECLINEGREAAAQVLCSMAAILEIEAEVPLSQLFPMRPDHQTNDNGTMISMFRKLFLRDPSLGQLKNMLAQAEAKRQIIMQQANLNGSALMKGVNDGSIVVMDAQQILQQQQKKG